MRKRITIHLKQRSEMLSGISHDLRTPLTRLKLQLAMLKQQDLAKKMGNAGHKFVEETFNWELITKNFIKIVNSHLK